ncbi:NAD-dependent epimerase/dehydratase family protein [Paenibacillus sp. Marseille-Q9583]
MGKRKILITGKGSYVGTNVIKWLEQWPDQYEVDEISVRGTAWKEHDFSQYDVLLHVAAVVHQKERSEMRELYFKVNKDLPIEIAKKAKKSGVGQFIFMSTMAVYGEEGLIGKQLVVDKNTQPNPKSYYGETKIKAEYELKKITKTNLKLVILRPPIIYGPDCPGNYAKLEYLASKTPIFPIVDNQRSMLHIDKLCDFIKGYIDHETDGVFFPQDENYVNTSLLVRNIAEKNGKRIFMSKLLGMIILMIGRRINLFKKIFGNLVYERLD